MLTIDLSPKLLQFVSELVPKAKTLAVLDNPNSSNAEATLRQVREAAISTAMQLRVLEAGNEAEIDAAFAAIDKPPADAAIVGADAFFTTRRDQIVALAARHFIPTVYSQGLFPKAGGLLSYGASLPAAYRLKGNYTGKILHGTRPADLPVQQPTKYELVINVKTAKALGLDMPPSLLARADEVIE